LIRAIWSTQKSETDLKPLSRLRLEELSRARSEPELFLEIVDFNSSKEAFGSVMEASFMIKNNALIDIKDITVLCEHSAASGTVIDRNSRTIYDVVKSKATRSFKKINMGFIHSQALRSACRITAATPL
jgi:hypothetical protein